MEQAVGAEGKLKVEIKEGKLVVSLVYDGKGLDGALTISADSDYFVDELAKLIPGDSIVEQMAVTTIKAALKNVKV